MFLHCSADFINILIKNAVKHIVIADTVGGNFNSLNRCELVANHLLHCFLKLRVAVIAELGCKTNNRTLADSDSFTKL